MPTVTPQTVTRDTSPLLFRTLAANAAFSGLSGLLLALAPSSIAAWLGLPGNVLLAPLGLMLIGFAALLFFYVRRQAIRRVEALVISALDLGWVLGSIALVLFAPGLFSGTGVIAVLAVAAVVLLFFEGQALALWRLGRATPTTRSA